MKRYRVDGLLLWAAREMLRRPGDAVLTGICLAVVTAMMAAALLLCQAVSDTAGRILSASPALVVRRIDAGGWVPIPVDEGISSIRAVPGVLSVRPRIWGTVRAEQGPVTVVGAASALRSSAVDGEKIQPPAVGRALIGPGVDAVGGRVRLSLGAQDSVSFSVAGRLPEKTAMATYDLVILSPCDAARVLGIAPGFASDLAVEVFHLEEAQALAPELAETLPWPVRITTRAEAAKSYSGAVFRRGSLAALALLPAVLALVFLVVVTVRERAFRRKTVGLFKALGWQTSDVFLLHLFESAMTAMPSVLLGMAVGYGLVFFPGVSWPSRLLLGWPRPAPGLFLDPAGALAVLAEIGAFILFPYLAAAAGPSLRASLADPQDLLEEGR
jgi:hypothetical protein